MDAVAYACLQHGLSLTTIVHHVLQQSSVVVEPLRRHSAKRTIALAKKIHGNGEHTQPICRAFMRLIIYDVMLDCSLRVLEIIGEQGRVIVWQQCGLERRDVRKQQPCDTNVEMERVETDGRSGNMLPVPRCQHQILQFDVSVAFASTVQLVHRLQQLAAPPTHKSWCHETALQTDGEIRCRKSRT